MPEQKVVVECCECGGSMLRFKQNRMPKKGWLCSKSCIESKRLKTHGKDCVNCGKRFVSHSKTQIVCSMECKLNSGNRLTICVGCGAEFKPQQKGQTACSMQCRSIFMRRKASRQCLCCGKTFYRRSLARKKPKSETSKRHNLFCSRSCSKKYVEWEHNRKARCKCGKATGLHTSVCLNCNRSPRVIARIDPWIPALKRMLSKSVEKPRDPWRAKLQSMVSANMHREAIAKKGRNYIVTIDHVVDVQHSNKEWDIALGKMSALVIARMTECPWVRKAKNWVTNHAKRLRVKHARQSRSQG